MLPGEPVAHDHPAWNTVLRALREARGVTQDGWATWLGVSEATVRRWERGVLVPNAEAEQALLGQCHARGLFRTFDQGPLGGLTLTPEWLRDLLAGARLGAGAERRAPSAETPPAADRGPRAAPARTDNLPAPLTTFVGRE